ncbi:response regulator [Streptomyces decoyicus]|uniref:Transcriptional regulatory protein n=1 Tax=Streptomyces decoyicus TaxID=249567 RepID=A0ABZ1FUZ2_9ACTN|nr:response regulator [Streptomyces decoyicus]WSB73896.1 response regulator [Streptomyces decoyicus]
MTTVLVVDDDFMVAKLHAQYVAALSGFSVVGVAHSGTEALRLATELLPNVVLLDVYLPDMDGISVLRQLRAQHEGKSVDALFVTAARDVDVIRSAHQNGALHYLIKPFDQASLHDQLRHVASLRQRFNEIGEASQEDVDRIFGTDRREMRGMPKGLAAQTAELVLRTLREHPQGISASECAQASVLSRVTARRYLEYFTETGRTEVALSYGNAGRPERRYRWIG